MTHKFTMKYKIIVGTLAALCFVLGAAGSSSAVINDDIQFQHATTGLGFTPTDSERLKFKPGDVYDGSFTVYNTAPDVTNVYAEVAPYSTGIETEYFTGDYTNPSDRTKIAEWTNIELSGCDVTKREDGKIYFTLRVKEECNISYHIQVPHDAYGGSQHAAILVQTYESKDQGKGGGIVSYYRIAFPIMANVDGPGAYYAGRILENNVPWLFLNPPVTTNSLVENTGNIDFDVKYAVTMHNFFGGKKVYENSSDLPAFADSRYRNTFEWKDAPILGLFKVTQKVELLNEMSEVTKLVLVVPIWLIIIILLVIALLVTAKVLKSREKKKLKQKGIYTN